MPLSEYTPSPFEGHAGRKFRAAKKILVVAEIQYKTTPPDSSRLVNLAASLQPSNCKEVLNVIYASSQFLM